MRGKRPGSRAYRRSDRLIPAYAGKTSRALKGMSVTPAHPRVCGENAVEGALGVSGLGSSPRMRGKPSPLTRPWMNPRLIPAYAGKTMARARNSGLARAHPRVCGENRVRASLRLPWVGSSPRMRGKHAVREYSDPRGRLIPAYAGKTQVRKRACAISRAHPRVCGENPYSYNLRTPERGSSPRMRGKHAYLYT